MITHFNPLFLNNSKEIILVALFNWSINGASADTPSSLVMDIASSLFVEGVGGSTDGKNRKRFDPRFEAVRAMATFVEAYNPTAWRI